MRQTSPPIWASAVEEPQVSWRFPVRPDHEHPCLDQTFRKTLQTVFGQWMAGNSFVRTFQLQVTFGNASVNAPNAMTIRQQ